MRGIALALLALILSAAHFFHFDVVARPIVTDVRYYLYFAWQIAEGAVPHTDLFAVKTQLASFTGAFFYRVADAWGADPLLIIRWGFLGIASLGGVLAFEIGRRLDAGRLEAGLLALTAHCAFALMGALPAVGPIPKLIMAVAASAVALLAHRQCFFWAGFCGGLAFLDYQLGFLAWLAALASAAVTGTDRRVALIRCVAGGAAAVIPLAIYYALHGGLSEAFRQVVLTSLPMGAQQVEASSLFERLSRMRELVDLTSPGYAWLVALAGLGLFVALPWLWGQRHRDSMGLLLPLSVYHVGVLGFSLLNFQWYGDGFLLLHTVTFFLGLGWIAALARLRDGLGAAGFGRGATRAAVVVVLVLAIVAVRPGPLQADLALQVPQIAPMGTLQDQQSVADQLERIAKPGEALFFASSELLFLMRYRNPTPALYWDIASWARYRRAGEGMSETAARIVREQRAQVLIYPAELPLAPDLRAAYRPHELRSPNGRYVVRLFLKAGANTGAVPNRSPASRPPG